MERVTSCYLSLLLSIYVTIVVVTQSVAPYDADSYCLGQSGRVPTSNNTIQCLVVYYDICPYQVKNLVIYPQRVASFIGYSQDIDTVGSCVENASPVSANLQITCELYGVWDNVAVSCSCNPGYKLSNNISCDGKKFKSIVIIVMCLFM